MTTPKLVLRSQNWRPAAAAPTGVACDVCNTPEQLALTRARLGHLALFTAGLILALQVIMHLQQQLLGWPAPKIWPQLRGAHFSLIVFSLLVYGLTRWRELPDVAMPTLGMGYQVLGAFLIALPGFSSDLLLQDDMGRVAWVGVWIAMFPLVVPLSPKRCALVSFGSATIPALIFGAWALSSGIACPPARTLTATFLPIYVAASLALIPAFVMRRLQTTANEAQDQVRSLGSYRLVDLLGRGGMGEVWRAEHQLLARPAAVKLISPELLAGDGGIDIQTAVARFEREARTTSALASPHTIALYDYGLAADGTLFYVMEHLDGLDLETLVSRFGPIPPARVASILQQVCCSLAEAHAAGLIHRDIKPANIYLCRLGVSVDFVKVLDFGLVGVSESLHDTGDVRLTDDDHIVGTPAYMPPEMAEGKPVDGRADLYSLGCVAYWLLTGEFVFQDESAVKMIIAHVKKEPERPSARLKRPIPEDLERVILGCLEKDPARRPRDAMALARQLEACDLPPWTQDQARAWWEEHMGEAAAAAASPETTSTSPTATWPHVPAEAISQAESNV